MVGFDVRPERNRGLPGHAGVDPQADAALVVSGRTAQVLQAAWWDPVGVLSGGGTGEIPFDPAALVPGSGAWQPARLLISHPLTRPDTGERLPARTADVSRLAAARRGATVTVRIPWALLGLADPSSRQAFVPHADGTVTLEPVPRIGVAVLAGSGPLVTARPVRWAPWNRARWHERRKAGWSVIARAFAAAAPADQPHAPTPRR